MAKARRASSIVQRACRATPCVQVRALHQRRPTPTRRVCSHGRCCSRHFFSAIFRSQLPKEFKDDRFNAAVWCLRPLYYQVKRSARQQESLSPLPLQLSHAQKNLVRIVIRLLFRLHTPSNHIKEIQIKSRSRHR